MFSWFRKRRRETQPALDQEQREHWEDRGFLILPQFFSPEPLEALLAEVRDTWESEDQSSNPLVVDVLEGELGGVRRRMRDLPTAVQHLSHKLNDLYLCSRLCRQIVLDAGLIAILRELLEDEPVAINSLNFEKGSRQRYHFDTYYMPPPIEGRMAVTSICLEDVHPDAGPLMYYPGSHVIPPFRFPHGGINQADADMAPATQYIEEALAQRNLPSETFCGRRGDVFIWHAQLYHGGSIINDPTRTRRSVVTHYWGREGMQGEIARAETGGLYLDRPHQPVPRDP